LIESLQPADITIEKIAYSAFYMSRLEWVLRRAGIKHLIFGGIVTNGGVASTAREAHVRDFSMTILSDGCAAFDLTTHEANILALSSIGNISTCEEVSEALSLS